MRVIDFTSLINRLRHSRSVANFFAVKNCLTLIDQAVVFYFGGSFL